MSFSNLGQAPSDVEQSRILPTDGQELSHVWQQLQCPDGRRSKADLRTRPGLRNLRGYDKSLCVVGVQGRAGMASSGLQWHGCQGQRVFSAWSTTLAYGGHQSRSNG